MRIITLFLGSFVFACGQVPNPSRGPAANAHIVGGYEERPTISIVCMGDSETYGRGLNRGGDYPSQLSTITGDEVINAGVSGNTTADMLARFQTDVIDTHPTYVIIVGGENDIYYGYDVTTNLDEFKLPNTEANIVAMVNRSYSNNIVPIIGTILPHGTIEQTPARQQAMAQLREWELFSLPISYRDIQVIDFYTLIEDPNQSGYPSPGYTLDLVHPSALGAQAMAEKAAHVLFNY